MGAPRFGFRLHAEYPFSFLEMVMFDIGLISKLTHDCISICVPQDINDVMDFDEEFDAEEEATLMRPGQKQGNSL